MPLREQRMLEPTHRLFDETLQAPKSCQSHYTAGFVQPGKSSLLAWGCFGRNLALGNLSCGC